MRLSFAIAAVFLLALPACTDGDATSEDSSLIAATEIPTQTEPPSSPVAEPSPTSVQAGQWQELSPLPPARSEVVAVALESKVFVIGSLTPDPGMTSRVEVYDPAGAAAPCGSRGGRG